MFLSSLDFFDRAKAQLGSKKSLNHYYSSRIRASSFDLKVDSTQFVGIPKCDPIPIPTPIEGIKIFKIFFLVKCN